MIIAIKPKFRKNFKEGEIDKFVNDLLNSHRNLNKVIWVEVAIEDDGDGYCIIECNFDIDFKKIKRFYIIYRSKNFDEGYCEWCGSGDLIPTKSGYVYCIDCYEEFKFWSSVSKAWKVNI